MGPVAGRLGHIVGLAVLLACSATRSSGPDSTPGTDTAETPVDSRETLPTTRTPSFGFGVNLYHTSPAFWPREAVGPVVGEVSRCAGYASLRSLRFFLPTLGREPHPWQSEWEAMTYDFIQTASRSDRIPDLAIAVGYGLDYHLSPDLAQALPDRPKDYIRGVAEAVEHQVRRTKDLTRGTSVNVCWQIENELDIAHLQGSRPGRKGAPWSDPWFARDLLVALQQAVERGWAEADPCLFVTMTPLVPGSKVSVYPWDLESWARSIDFVGLHYYPFGSGEVAEEVSGLITASILQIIETTRRPVLITEFGIQMTYSESGEVKDPDYAVFWMKELAEIVRDLKEAGKPILGLQYFKFDDADASTEAACGYQGYMGFYRLGGTWFGHESKRFPPGAAYPDPWSAWCEIAAGESGGAHK